MCHYQCLGSLFLTQSKSVTTDIIKEWLSRIVIISSSCLEVTCNKKEMKCFHTGLLSLLKVATNCLRVISQECAIEINTL